VRHACSPPVGRAAARGADHAQRCRRRARRGQRSVRHAPGAQLSPGPPRAAAKPSARRCAAAADRGS
jgi:hypothetical protein